MNDESEAQFDRLSAAWREFRDALDAASITARVAFLRCYPVANKLLRGDAHQSSAGYNMEPK